MITKIGLARAEATLSLAEIAYNVDRLIFHERRQTMGGSARHRRDSLATAPIPPKQA